MDEDLKSRIENDFAYHKVPSVRIKDLGTIREKCKELALLFEELVPRGREQASALTRLEEAMFHANSGISRKHPIEVANG